MIHHNLTDYLICLSTKCALGNFFSSFLCLIFFQLYKISCFFLISQKPRFLFLKLCYIFLSHHSVLWLGQSIQGVEPGKLQAEDQSHWSQKVPEHSDCVSRWVPLCSRKQGWPGYKQLLSSQFCYYNFYF